MSAESCVKRWPIAQPFIGSRASILRIKRSSVPWTRSLGRLIRSPIGNRGEDTPFPLGKQEVEVALPYAAATRGVSAGVFARVQPAGEARTRRVLLNAVRPSNGS